MLIKFIIALGLLCVIAVIDLVSYRIPDVLVAMLFVCALIFDVIKNPKGLVMSFTASCIVFLIFYLVYRIFGGIGFGDVKLAACIAYVFGFFDSLFICLVACITGIIFFIIDKFFGSKRLKRLPFAPFIFIGALVVVCFRGRWT